MRTRKHNDIRPNDCKQMANVPWSVDNGVEWSIDQNPAVKKYGVQESEQIPSMLNEEIEDIDGKKIEGLRRSKVKLKGKTSDGILGKIARKESRENQVERVKVLASYQGVKNEEAADTKKRKKRKNPGSRPRTVR